MKKEIEQLKNSITLNEKIDKLKNENLNLIKVLSGRILDEVEYLLGIFHGRTVEPNGRISEEEKEEVKSLEGMIKSLKDEVESLKQTIISVE